MPASNRQVLAETRLTLPPCTPAAFSRRPHGTSDRPIRGRRIAGRIGRRCCPTLRSPDSTWESWGRCPCTDQRPPLTHKTMRIRVTARPVSGARQVMTQVSSGQSTAASAHPCREVNPGRDRRGAHAENCCLYRAKFPSVYWRHGQRAPYSSRPIACVACLARENSPRSRRGLQSNVPAVHDDLHFADRFD